MNFQRRDVLKMGGATLGSTALAGLAGCSSVFGGGGSFDYESWLLKPSLLDTDHYHFAIYDVSDFVDNEDELDRESYESLVSYFESRPLGMDVEDMGSILEGSSYSVVTGNYDEDDVIDELRDEGYTRGREYEGYQIQIAGDESDAYGVSGSEIVKGVRTHESAEAMVKYLVDTANGDEDRYSNSDVSRDMSTLVDELSSGSLVNARTHERHQNTDVQNGRFEYQEAEGSVFDIEGETSDVTLYLVFRDAGDIVIRDIEDWTESDGNLEDVDDISVSANDNVVSIEGSIDTDEY